MADSPLVILYPRILVSMFLGAFLGGLLLGLTSARTFGLLQYPLTGRHTEPFADVLSELLLIGCGIGLPFGLGYGRGNSALKRVNHWRAISVRSVLTGGLLYAWLWAFVDSTDYLRLSRL